MTGLVFAVCGAIGYGLASVLQAVAARGAGGAFRTLGRPLYLLGVGLDLLGWACSLVALRTLPVVEVQTILAGSLAVTALIGRFALRIPLRRVDIGAITVTIVALGVVAASSGPQPTSQPGFAVTAALSVAPVFVAAVGALVARWSAAGSALVAGVAFGGAALCARVVSVPAHSPLTAIVIQPPAWALVGFGITGMLLYAHALEGGAVGPATALLWIAEVIAPTLAGALLFGDPIPTTPPVVAALLVALAAAVVLANAPPWPLAAKVRVIQVAVPIDDNPLVRRGLRTRLVGKDKTSHL